MLGSCDKLCNVMYILIMSRMAHLSRQPERWSWTFVEQVPARRSQAASHSQSSIARVGYGSDFACSNFGLSGLSLLAECVSFHVLSYFYRCFFYLCMLHHLHPWSPCFMIPRASGGFLKSPKSLGRSQTPAVWDPREARQEVLKG